MPSAKYLPAEARRAETVEAVVALAAEQNPGDITTAAIASRLGLTQGALFRHFPNKDAILEAVMAWVSDRLLSRVDTAMAGATTPLAAMEAAFLAHAAFVSEHPGVPRMLFGELQRSEDTAAKRLVRTLLGRYRERLARLVEQGKREGSIAADVDTGVALSGFIGTLQGLVIQSLLSGEPGRIREGAPAAFALYRRGIGSQA
ncbi:TetR/AcrR family transcriptional regulator [Arenimonas malthae]|nr:TetR/AcrR family transcriptional regulator [Arenimonas malthae]